MGACRYKLAIAGHAAIAFVEFLPSDEFVLPKSTAMGWGT